MAMIQPNFRDQVRDATHLDKLTQLKSAIEHLVSLFELAVLDHLASITASFLLEPSLRYAAAKALTKVDREVGEVAHRDGRCQVYLPAHFFSSIRVFVNLMVLKEGLAERLAAIWWLTLTIAWPLTLIFIEDLLDCRLLPSKILVVRDAEREEASDADALCDERLENVGERV